MPRAARTIVTPVVTALAIVFAAVSCDRREPDKPATEQRSTAAPPAAASTTRPTSAPRVVFLGDSITAGLGLSADEAFPAVVAAMLEQEGIRIDAVNAGVSGDTTAGGLRRLDWLLRQSPDVLVVGLGGNDGLRGLDVNASRDNLTRIVRKARDAGAKVLLLGMMMPPNYGPEYTKEFREIYPQLAKELDVPLVPFLLEGVGGERALNQPDGIHPTAEGHRAVAQNVLPHLRDLLPRQLPTTRPVH
jgi:acyl-CoA thioesterase I